MQCSLCNSMSIGSIAKLGSGHISDAATVHIGTWVSLVGFSATPTYFCSPTGERRFLDMVVWVHEFPNVSVKLFFRV